MFDRITRKTAFYAVGGGVGAAIAEIITEPLSLNANEPATFIELIAHTALWMGIIALGISIGLALAQNFSLKRAPRADALAKAAAIGLISGAIAGAIAQFIFGFASAMLRSEGAIGILLFIQALCWGLAGLGVGLGVSFYVPNYPTKRAILAGFLGGAIGGAAFILLNLIGIPEAFARVVGIAILGATIGLTISAVEEMLREAWLTIIWGKNETSSVSLGQKPVVLGGASEADIHLPRNKFPPVTAVVTIENGKVMLDNKLNNQKIALPNGSKINIGKITIVVNTRKSVAGRQPDIQRR
jgi:Ca-activated chloride channel family protein